MEFFCYHRDRSGSTPLRSRMVEEHWAHMDRFAATMIARGPTFTSDGTLTGRVQILVLGFVEPTTGAVATPVGDELVASGPLVSDDGRVALGAAVLLEAPHADAAREVLADDRYVGVEVHQWRFGGRPD